MILFQGGALLSMLDLFRALVDARNPQLTQKKLLETLVNPVLDPNGVSIHKQVKK